MDLAAVMDEIAGRVELAPSLAGRTYAWPIATASPPAAVVGYPETYTFDATYGRGVDTMNPAIVVFVGRPTDRSTRDLIAKYVAGDGLESIKALVDGEEGDYTSCDGVRVASVGFDVYLLGGVDMLVAVFSLDIAGPGTA